MDWDLKGLTGSEIYNLHADFKDETRLIKSMRTPLGLLTLLPISRQYPQETMAALMDYPADYLRRYDELCLKERLTGIAANDSHHNNGDQRNRHRGRASCNWSTRWAKTAARSIRRKFRS